MLVAECGFRQSVRACRVGTETAWVLPADTSQGLEDTTSTLQGKMAWRGCAWVEGALHATVSVKQGLYLCVLTRLLPVLQMASSEGTVTQIGLLSQDIHRLTVGFRLPSWWHG